jgi:hypothetical protein
MHALVLLLALASPGDVAAVTPPVILAQQDEMHDHADHAVEVDHFDDAPMQRSKLRWLADALGIRYTMLFLLTGPLVFLGSLIVVALCRRPAPIAAFFPFVAIPFLIGIFGFFDGAISAFTVIASSSVSPKPSEIASGISTALVTPMVGLLLSVPSYLILSTGLFIRALLYRAPVKP